VNHVLEPLIRIPGVRCALISTPDGVPIAMRGELDAASRSDGGDALAGLVAGWLNSLGPSLGLVSWDLPQRIVLRAARGTLIVRRAPTAILLVVLEPGSSAEELRLPLEAALNRLQRVARGPRPSAPSAALPARNPKGSASSGVDSSTLPRP
jgi:predicted regulator of Ras-like GTPase activity (Roadblock/LC7/MglB family)